MISVDPAPAVGEPPAGIGATALRHVHGLDPDLAKATLLAASLELVLCRGQLQRAESSESDSLTIGKFRELLIARSDVSADFTVFMLKLFHSPQHRHLVWRLALLGCDTWTRSLSLEERQLATSRIQAWVDSLTLPDNAHNEFREFSTVVKRALVFRRWIDGGPSASVEVRPLFEKLPELAELVVQFCTHE